VPIAAIHALLYTSIVIVSVASIILPSLTVSETITVAASYETAVELEVSSSSSKFTVVHAPNLPAESSRIFRGRPINAVLGSSGVTPATSMVVLTDSHVFAAGA